VKYHGLARRQMMPLGFLMRPLLNGGTLGGRMQGPALHADLEAVEAWAGGLLPTYYRQFLLDHPAGVSGNRVLLYEIDAVIERNDTYETKKYCPGYITIGDDSGGRAVVVSLQDEAGAIFLVDHGCMTPDGFEPIAPSFRPWFEQGCPLPD
jgi:hypothetical protein